MTIEATIYSSLRALVSDRCYPDIAPELTDRPYITYQQVGGDAVNFIDSAIPSKSNGRFQINVWGDTRAQAASIAKQVEEILRSLQATVLGAPAAIYEQATQLRGTRQDFSIWQ